VLVRVQMMVVVGRRRLRVLMLELRAARRWRGMLGSRGCMVLLREAEKVVKRPFVRVAVATVGMVRLVGWGWMLMVVARLD